MTDTAPRPIGRTCRLFIGGAFVPGDEGRRFVVSSADGASRTECARASRGDFDRALGQARAAQRPWAARSAFQRGQILFRLAERLEARRSALEQSLVRLAGMRPGAAAKDVRCAIDRVFWYAGWADKYAQLFGSLNPVASPRHSISAPGPVGVVVLAPSASSPLVGLLSLLAPALVPGNAAVVLVRSGAPSLALDLAEMLTTSDVPAGVVNILTCEDDELLGAAAAQADVAALACCGVSSRQHRKLELAAGRSQQRLIVLDDRKPGAWRKHKRQAPGFIESFAQLKTIWHPVGY